jgi:hypothetical protein
VEELNAEIGVVFDDFDRLVVRSVGCDENRQLVTGIIEAQTVFDLLADDFLFVERGDEKANPGKLVGRGSASLPFPQLAHEKENERITGVGVKHERKAGPERELPHERSLPVNDG